MKTDTVISVKNLYKTFRIPHKKIDSMRKAFVNGFSRNTHEEFKALDDVSFEVKKGEFLGIIGRNGSGKSTLLKILAGVYSGDSGEININGRISPFLELGIGFNPELSGRDNVYMNATVLGLSKRDIDQRFDSIVDFSEIKRFIDQQVKNYSSGMKSRLAFSVAIHVNRDILLMDEVLAVGDISFEDKCYGVFKEFKKTGKTVILVTHAMDVVDEFCDRVLILDRSRIVNGGNPEQMVKQYSQMFHLVNS
ncbi:MAG: ABC transporter ATP-binding protein [Desulfobacterales bacterium]|jgi:ABC-type polysaccharide/polyol phosphate transport system ATPase subunit|nr:ABC transporter ATP-binding protein [Desulfobacterales bacterium]